MAIRLPTLSHLVTAHDTSHFVQVAPSPSHVRAKRDAHTLIVANHFRISSLIWQLTYTFTGPPTGPFLWIRPE